MKRHFVLIAFVSLCGCSKLADTWTCSVMGGHEHVVFEKMVDYEPKKMLSTVNEIAQKEGLMFGYKNVEIVSKDRRKTRLLIEACDSKVQVLVNNFEYKNSFRIYVRSSNDQMNQKAKRIVFNISNLR